MNELEFKISHLYDFKAKGAQIRSRIQVLEDGEKNTKYFVNLEKSRQLNKTQNWIIES